MHSAGEFLGVPRTDVNGMNGHYISTSSCSESINFCVSSSLVRAYLVLFYPGLGFD